MILDDFSKAVGQMGDPRFLRVVGLSMLLALALFTGAAGLTYWLAALVLPESFSLPFIGPIGGVGTILSWALSALVLAFSLIFIAPVASAISTLFLDSIAEAVEARHYPGLGPANRQTLATTLADALSFLLRGLIANALTLIPALLFPPAAPFLFLAVNGRLIGRELFLTAALRRYARAPAKDLTAQNGTEIWLAGAAMTLALALPLLNMVIPILGAASFTHMVQRLGRPQPAGGPIR